MAGIKKIYMYDKQPRKSHNPALNVYHQQEFTKQQQMRDRMKAAAAAGFRSNSKANPYS